MRHYRDDRFAAAVAEHAQDALDECLLELGPVHPKPKQASNLGRASGTLGRDTLRMLYAMHEIERAYLDVCLVRLPRNAPRDIVERLHDVRIALLDLTGDVAELWEAEARSIWNGLSLESKVRRLKLIACQMEDCRADGEETDQLSELLRMRAQMDPAAARLADVDALDQRTAADLDPSGQPRP